MSAAITITIIGDEQVLTALRQMRQGAAQAQRTVLRTLGDRYVTVLKAETPEGRGERPGRLRAGYTTEGGASPTQATYRITNTVPHLRYVLQGRGPVHAISTKALRFVINGQVIFRRSVGPAAPNPFPARARRTMQPAITQAAPEIAALIVRAYKGGA